MGRTQEGCSVATPFSKKFTKSTKEEKRMLESVPVRTCCSFFVAFVRFVVKAYVL